MKIQKVGQIWKAIEMHLHRPGGSANRWRGQKVTDDNSLDKLFLFVVILCSV